MMTNGAVSISSAPQFVIKASKYCNLRCDYCYEFPHLGDKTRMSLNDVKALFENVQRSSAELGVAAADFIWHGGEPFLIPIEFYEQAGRIQKDVFGTGFSYENSVQTNLTILTDRHIDFLKTGDFFKGVGVSFDVYGDQRVDTKGRLRTDIVLANMQKLIDHGIAFGAIAVLARNTLPSIKRIYKFFDDLNVDHRILAYYRRAGSEQDERHGIEHEELVGALKDVFHEWLASECATPVDPIAELVQFAVGHVTNAPLDYFDRSKNERVFIVQVNGDMYNVVESNDPEFCYGNLFRAPLLELAASEPRRRSIALSQERTQLFCRPCPYFGHCPGAFVSNATDVERELLAARGCPIRAMLDHIVGVFERTDLKEHILKMQAGDRAAANPALSVG